MGPFIGLIGVEKRVRDGDFVRAAAFVVADQIAPRSKYNLWRWWQKTFGQHDQFEFMTTQFVLGLFEYFRTGNYVIRQTIARILGGKSAKITPRTSAIGLLRQLRTVNSSPWPIPDSLKPPTAPPKLPNLSPVISRIRWSKRSTQPRERYCVDLRNDSSDIASLFSRCVDWYLHSAEKHPMPAVGAVGAGFRLCQSGWLCPYFEFRSKSEYDANWAASKGGAIVRLPHWHKFHDQAKRSGCEFILPHGRRIKVKPNVSCERLAAIFGGMIRDVLKLMKKEKQFDKLPLRKGFYMFVDEFDGLWGWLEKRSKT